MTLQQEAYRRIDEMTGDDIRKLIDIIDKMKTVSVTGFKDVNKSTLTVSENIPMTKAEKSSALSSRLERSKLMQKQSVS